MNKILSAIEDKIVPAESLEIWRDLNSLKKIVSTNGVFDILHRGHVTYLSQARQLGDLLIVALNGDESVKRLKGPLRPVNTLIDRMFVLAALQFVDFVTFFNEDTPLDILNKIRPTIHVKGGDYKIEDLPETPIVRSHGGEIKIISFVDGFSTTNTIERIHGS